ncbi:hypothetical protein V490_06230 [Pseudogymnoascus sp. VKM F-3557]|nr:hypothetical protein V490_06230 [Pseudogymnoascus sp. VKM F-3557]
MCSRYLVGASIVSLAAALTPYNNECGPTLDSFGSLTDADKYFNDTQDVALYIRCTETTYACNVTVQGAKWFMINSTNEPVPDDCFKSILPLITGHNYTGPLELPGVTVLPVIVIKGSTIGTFLENGYRGSDPFEPTNITSIDLPDLVNITGDPLNIENAASVSSLNLPKLRHVYGDLILNFTGGPAINLSFPSLFDVGGIEIRGEIHTLDFPALNKTGSIMVNSTGDLDCDAFAKSLVNTTKNSESGVSCASRRGNFTLTYVEPPEPEVTSGAFKIREGSLSLTGLLAYILARYGSNPTPEEECFRREGVMVVVSVQVRPRLTGNSAGDSRRRDDLEVFIDGTRSKRKNIKWDYCRAGHSVGNGQARFAAMEQHENTVSRVAAAVQGFSERGEPYRIFHGSSNTTRPRVPANIIDISALSNVVLIDVKKRTALVEPNVPMDRLVEATLPYGLVPPVVMEFPGITAGGGFSGTSGESSSFRHGFFNDSIIEVEMILGNGEIVKASTSERPDLFHGAAGALGTLGTVTLMELRLVEAKKFVKTTYLRLNSVSEAIGQVHKETGDFQNDYVDGILFSKHHGVIITGQLTDDKPDNFPLQTFSDAADPWFYLHVQQKTENIAPFSSVTEYIPLPEYLFRYDRAAFWVGRQGYTYFKYIPFNSFFRWLLDDFSHTRTLYHALHASGVSSQFVVQDLAIPYSTANAFVDFISQEFGIWPLWLCPLRPASTPTFHPVTRDGDAKEEAISTSVSRPMLSIGVWGWGPQNYDEFIAKNRALEKKLDELGGRKWLYAQTYYTEAEFWKIYDRPWYASLRSKYIATTLPSVFDKVKANIHAGRSENKGWSQRLSQMWPIGGLYGMLLALKSGDFRLHRDAKWKLY